MSDKIAELILEQLFILQNNCATKGDLKAMEERIDSKIDAKFAEQDKRIDAKFAEQDKKIDAKFAEQDKRIDAKFAEQDKKIDAKFAEQDKRIDAKFEEQDKKIDAKFAEQAIEISEQFRMAFESADRIHNKMEANINKRNDKKISQALQF